MGYAGAKFVGIVAVIEGQGAGQIVEVWANSHIVLTFTRLAHDSHDDILSIMGCRVGGRVLQ